MTAVLGVWYGGPNYSSNGWEDVEVFDSEADAKRALINRRERGHWEPQECRYLNKEHSTALTPCVDDESSISLYPYEAMHYEYSQQPDYPYAVLVWGPRGGVVKQSV